jgi:predicted TIM-barrel fold metal-dependent hydrolase
MVRQYEELGVRSYGAFNAGYNPQVGIDDARMYPIYAKCVELGTPIFSCAGVPGPRFPMWPQEVSRIDQVMYDFPELVFVTRHGCEPWEDLAVKLMLKWPNLYYSTSAFAPKHYPKAVIDYANTRGADKVMYAGYFPMGLTLERIMSDMQALDLKDDVWPRFLRDNARRVLKLDE